MAAAASGARGISNRLGILGIFGMLGNRGILGTSGTEENEEDGMRLGTAGNESRGTVAGAKEEENAEVSGAGVDAGVDCKAGIDGIDGIDGFDGRSGIKGEDRGSDRLGTSGAIFSTCECSEFSPSSRVSNPGFLEPGIGSFPCPIPRRRSKKESFFVSEATVEAMVEVEIGVEGRESSLIPFDVEASTPSFFFGFGLNRDKSGNRNKEPTTPLGRSLSYDFSSDKYDISSLSLSLSSSLPSFSSLSSSSSMFREAGMLLSSPILAWFSSPVIY